jgi:predicted ATPase
MIKSLQILPTQSNEYPFNIPAIQHIDKLTFAPITIFVGDNGSGKSTLLKAIAHYNSSINVSAMNLDSTHGTNIQALSKKCKLTYTVKTRSGFFFSGEEFITYINHLKTMKEQLQQDIKEIKQEFKNKDAYSMQLALGPLRKELYALEEKYQGELGQKSHGEGFLAFFKARMHQKGIYLLDEPETPLSPINQYQLLVLITDLVRNGSQVILATHSPILMALKDALIYQFDDTIKQIDYDDIESVQFMKHFLQDKNNFIERL